MKAYIAYIIVDGSVLAAFARRLILQGNGACAIRAFLRRAKQQQLAAIELAKSEELCYKELYNRLRLSGKLRSVVDTDPFERYFKYSGLPKTIFGRPEYLKYLSNGSVSTTERNFPDSRKRFVSSLAYCPTVVSISIGSLNVAG